MPLCVCIVLIGRDRLRQGFDHARQAKNSIRLERPPLRYIQSLLAAGAVWLNLGPPRQPEGRRPEGCRGGPRCSQTAPATRRDCVYHHGTDTRLEQVKLEKIELEKKAF